MLIFFLFTPQNLVDALGAEGVQGGLAAGMGSTFRVMRESRQLLSTVLGVLRHDPLQQWELSPRQVCRVMRIFKIYFFFQTYILRHLDSAAIAYTSF